MHRLLGSGGGARISGFSWLESLQMGIGMVSRGEVGLIVAAFALTGGLLSQENFSIAVFMVIIATLVLTMLIPLQYAVLIGVALSIILYVGRQSNRISARPPTRTAAARRPNHFAASRPPVSTSTPPPMIVLPRPSDSAASMA